MTLRAILMLCLGVLALADRCPAAPAEPAGHVTGAVLWIGSVTLLGFAIGNLSWVKGHLQWIFLAMIIIPGVLALIGILRKKKTQAPA